MSVVGIAPRYIPVDERDRPDTPEIAELRMLVEEHDELMEDCMKKVLTREEQKGLDEIIATLTFKEHELWPRVPDEIVEMIMSHSDADYPMIRMTLGYADPSEY